MLLLGRLSPFKLIEPLENIPVGVAVLALELSQLFLQPRQVRAGLRAFVRHVFQLLICSDFPA